MLRRSALPDAIIGRLNVGSNMSRLQLTEPEIRETVSLGISCAERFGVSHDPDFMLFVGLMFETTLTFYSHPLALPYLNNETRSAHDRLSDLIEHFTDSEWNNVIVDTSKDQLEMLRHLVSVNSPELSSHR